MKFPDELQEIVENWKRRRISLGLPVVYPPIWKELAVDEPPPDEEVTFL